jgi:hypothetical protein
MVLGAKLTLKGSRGLRLTLKGSRYANPEGY